MPPKVVCVVGPTACGKTRLGVEIARHMNGEVVSADSMQLYRGMAIGTAAPTTEEREGVPHYMIGVADPAEQYSAARYAAEADACMQDILKRGKLPIIVGGTGLYLDALVRGSAFAPGGRDSAVRAALQQRLDREGSEPLLEELRRVDPETAGRLSPRDVKRILRALEVYRTTGETISRHNAATREQPSRYDAVYIGLAFADREDMRALIDQRVDRMVEQGLLEEVNRLLASGLDRSATAWQAIGYKQFLAVADGRISTAEAVEEVKLRSRQYAKRQLTWLRRNDSIHWILWGKNRNFPEALQIATEILTAEGLS